jgi:RimJ/RimL family protein N-acetyltransferase
MRPDPSFTELLTPRLRLRRSVPADAEPISGYRSLPEVHVHQGWDRTDPDGVRAEIEEMATRVPGEPGGWVQFTVERREDGEIVGDVGLSPDDADPAVIKVGYTVSPVHQRNGFATEAVRALVDYAFGVLDAEVVRAFADAGNLASRRVMEKAGLSLAETFEYPDEDGVWLIVRYERRRDDPSLRPDRRAG